MDIKEKAKLLQQVTVTSWHEHIQYESHIGNANYAFSDSFIDTISTLGIDRVVSSVPCAEDRHCSPEQFTAANNLTYEMTKRYPGKVYGQAFLNPAFCKETIYELERCVKELGFVGVKLYHQNFMDNPVMYPMIEKCIELDVPILMHCAHIMDPETRLRQPRCSSGIHMANVAKRYPEATFLMGHIGGGGDWKLAIKAIADTPNVYADIGGSIYDRPLIEESVKLLGADRMLFATDGGWSSGVGKLLGADISDADKKTIFESRAFNRFIERAGK